MLTILIALIFFTLLILGHELGHFLLAKFFKTRVDEFGIGFPPRIFAKKIGETEYSLNLIPFGGFVKIYGENPAEKNLEKERSFKNLVASKRAAIIAAGVLMNFLIGYLAISIVFMIGIPSSVFIGEVVPGGPAALAGLEPGDGLVGFSNPAQFSEFVKSKAGDRVALSIRRNGKDLTVEVVPRKEPPAGQGPLGILITEGGIPRQSPPQALIEGAKVTVETTKAIVLALVGLFKALGQADLEPLSGVAGPVGIFGILGTTTKLGLVYLLQLLGLISLNLAVLNLLPIPALDGGRLTFLLLEKLIGRPLHYKFEALTHTLGFILLILLMTIVTIRDIIKIL